MICLLDALSFSLSDAECKHLNKLFKKVCEPCRPDALSLAPSRIELSIYTCFRPKLRPNEHFSCPLNSPIWHACSLLHNGETKILKKSWTWQQKQNGDPQAQDYGLFDLSQEILNGLSKLAVETRLLIWFGITKRAGKRREQSERVVRSDKQWNSVSSCSS